MDCLLLVTIKVNHIGTYYNKQWYYKGSPEGCHHDDDSANRWEGHKITKTNGAYCYNYYPNGLEKLVKIYQTKMAIVDNLENSKLIGEYESRNY